MMDKSLTEWLSYLETLHPKTIDMGLQRIMTVASRLQIFPWQVLTITVTGTNGKGSTAMLLEAIYTAAGFRVGVYTSPHLVQYNERVRINQKSVADVELCEAFFKIEKTRGDVSLTYFEFGTLAALLIFKNTPLDVIILEVGLGGRLDAVNIIDSDMAIISSISLDHVDYLGPNRETIGYEKSGIMRENKPCVCGDVNPPQTLFLQANQINSNLYCRERDFFYEEKQNTWHWYGKNKKLLDLPLPNILLQNAATVLQAITLLDDQLPVAIESIKEGLKNVFIPGRQQKVFWKVPIILDVAHNPEAGYLLANRLRNEKVLGKTMAVFAMLQDKDILATVSYFRELVDTWYIAGISGPRGLASSELAGFLQTAGIEKIREFPDVTTAFTEAHQAVLPCDRIVVFGSFYTVAPIFTIVYNLS